MESRALFPEIPKSGYVSGCGFWNRKKNKDPSKFDGSLFSEQDVASAGLSMPGMLNHSVFQHHTWTKPCLQWPPRAICSCRPVSDLFFAAPEHASDLLLRGLRHAHTPLGVIVHPAEPLVLAPRACCLVLPWPVKYMITNGRVHRRSLHNRHAGATPSHAHAYTSTHATQPVSQRFDCLLTSHHIPDRDVLPNNPPHAPQPHRGAYSYMHACMHAYIPGYVDHC